MYRFALSTYEKKDDGLKLCSEQTLNFYSTDDFVDFDDAFKQVVEQYISGLRWNLVFSAGEIVESDNLNHIEIVNEDTGELMFSIDITGEEL